MANREKDILAAEYALGTLEGDELKAAGNAYANDHEFAEQVELWERRFATLSEADSETPAPAGVWQKIESQLPAQAQPFDALSAKISQIQRSLAIWRAATMGAAVAAIAFAMIWMGGLQSPFAPPAAAERYVAVLQDQSGKAGFVVTMDRGNGQFAVKPVSASVPASKSYELWCIMPGKNSAMTVGLVGTEAYAMMDMPMEIKPEELKKGVQLAVSLEPEGGAPHGQPMGPVVYAGLLVKQTP